MSFLNPVPVPATYYSSADAEAPQLGADLTGGVKTVLKACLVTGYGTKPGAGWTMTGEEDHKAVFTAPDPAPQVSLTVDSSNAQWTLFDLLWRGHKQGLVPTTHGYIKAAPHIGISPRWQLVATKRGFAFIPDYVYNSQSNQTIFYFGGLNHNLTNPAGQDFACYCSTRSSGLDGSALINDLLSGSPWALGAGDLVEDGNIQARVGFRSLITAVTGGAQAIRPLAGIAAKTYAEIYLTRAPLILGKLPGLLLCSHYDDVPGITTIDGSPHRWIYTRQNNTFRETESDMNGLGLLVNLDEWGY